MSDDTNPIEAARERLDGGRKWLKGHWRDGATGSVCLLGAVAEMTGSYDYTSEEDALERVVCEQFPDRLVNPIPRLAPGHGELRLVPEFNDHPLTTWPDVDLVLDKAARQWDETHGGAL